MDTVDPVTDRTPELLNLIAGSWTSDALAAALALELPRLLTEKPRDATELATVTRCEPAALARLLRALATIDICAEGPDGCFAMTPMSSGRSRRGGILIGTTPSL